MDGLAEPRPACVTLGWCDPQSALARFIDAPGVLLLQGGGGPSGRYSYLTAFPEFTILEDDPAVGFKALKDQFRSALSPLQAGFYGGYAGLLSYDLGQAFERVPNMASGLTSWPAIAMGWYGAALVFDHETRTLVARGDRDGAERLIAVLNDDARSLQIGSGRLDQVWDDRRYIHAVERALAYIRAGDVFQVNLSHPFRGHIEGRDGPAGLMARLAELSPAGFSGYCAIDKNRVVVTNSPERFLSLDGPGQITTRPIKGTAPRHDHPVKDAASRAHLMASQKDRAENLMIVDLMRNDLSRVCQAGSVATPDLFALETLSNVHHLVSTVTGQLADDKTVFDLLEASFPPGSITGAPKPRAMEIIAELEGQSRGPYCGALGWIGSNGACDFNVMIRTAACVRNGDDWHVEVRSGGGITIGSDPQAELEETRAKARALKSAIEIKP